MKPFISESNIRISVQALLVLPLDGTNAQLQGLSDSSQAPPFKSILYAAASLICDFRTTVQALWGEQVST